MYSHGFQNQLLPDIFPKSSAGNCQRPGGENQSRPPASQGPFAQAIPRRHARRCPRHCPSYNSGHVQERWVFSLVPLSSHPRTWLLSSNLPKRPGSRLPAVSKFCCFSYDSASDNLVLQNLGRGFISVEPMEAGKYVTASYGTNVNPRLILVTTPGPWRIWSAARVPDILIEFLLLRQRYSIETRLAVPGRAGLKRKDAS